ncbi:serine-threonineeeee protein kinase [Parachaetomium inaequale]|uniref:non-specific serine/threonine protein kinase n=1 Tax=Parachaetomium inaequale TaxID=2588326 RepID=A0AAN6SL26_9PEZI|nr:serine-threonineeeee protein kinase [Parachaetomium inaequale]
MATPRGGTVAHGADPGDIDEGRDAYRPGGFHPVYVEDVYADKYKILNKIGYGVYSTVWLVKDLTKLDDDEHKFLALKVLSAESYNVDKPIFEREILTHLRDGDRRQLGYKYVCHLVDDFEHQGPNGTHVCLVFELMGETLRTFGAWFKESIFHIKPDNIFVKFRDRPLIESGYLVNVPIPQQDRAEERYTPVQAIPLRRYYFGESDSTRVSEFDIARADWGVSSWATQHLTERIQPVALRAPEVLIEAPWDKTVDWWNLGALLLELYCAVRMFDGRVPPDGHYELKEHVAEIVDLFGPFPKVLLEKGNQDLVRSIFDDEGKPKDTPPGTGPPLASEGYMPGLSQEARDEFASFLKAMMKINPAERPSIEDLLSHPWVGLRFRTL